MLCTSREIRRILLVRLQYANVYKIKQCLRCLESLIKVDIIDNPTRKQNESPVAVFVFYTLCCPFPWIVPFMIAPLLLSYVYLMVHFNDKYKKKHFTVRSRFISLMICLIRKRPLYFEQLYLHARRLFTAFE
jgi:hypothetical protein